MAGLPCQGRQGGRHAYREAYPAPPADQGGGQRVLPPLHGVPVPARLFLHDQLQGIGRVSQNRKPGYPFLSAGGHRRDKPPVHGQALYADERQRLCHRHRPVLLPDASALLGLCGFQPGGADSRTAQAAPQAAGQSETARLHARPQQQDCQGGHRGGA